MLAESSPIRCQAGVDRRQDIANQLGQAGHEESEPLSGAYASPVVGVRPKRVVVAYDPRGCPLVPVLRCCIYSKCKGRYYTDDQ